ncbi:hypothetical protein E8E15_005449 [Penicillium rubens]|nr:hypothetical protein E8E15_005449 [Penicillium rubens]
MAYPTHRGILNSLFMSDCRSATHCLAGVSARSRNPPVAGIGRPEEEAHVVLVQYHAAGDASSPLVNYKFREIISAIRAEKEANIDGSYMEMVKTPGNRRRLMISISLGIFAQWAGNGVISYYLSLILISVGVTNVRDRLVCRCGI